MSRSEQTDIQPDSSPAPGAQLRAAREAQGLSIVEAASRLHLHQRMVEALESDDENRMPMPIYARGYLRNYARLTGLDPDAIVADYDRLGQKGPELKPPMKPPGQASSSDKPVKAVTYLLSLGLVLLLIAWWQSRNMEDDSRMDMENWQTSSEDSGSTPTGQPTGEQIQPAPMSGEKTVRVDSLNYSLQIISHPDTPFYPLPTGVEEMPMADTGLEGDTPAPAERPDAAGTAATDTTAGADTEVQDTATNADVAETGTDTKPPTLQLDLNADSWIEIYDADGERVYMGLGRADESLTFEGELPLEIVLGYAPGVEVTFRGQNIDTGRHSRAGVARFTVGE